MLSKTKVQNTLWPSLKSPTAPKHVETASPPKLISVTGKNCRVGFDIKHQQFGGNDSDSTEQNDDYVPAPQYKQSFSDAIALALEQSANQICNDEKPITNNDISADKQKKKQKRKGKILFATGLACRK